VDPEVVPLRVGQFSAYYGDRADALDELIGSGVDVLTGDYLAELTMLVLRKAEMRGRPGYAESFVEQLRERLSAVAENGIKVIANAGGLQPLECAEEIRRACREAGVSLSVAAIVGDNLVDDIPSLAEAGEKFLNLDDGRALELRGAAILTANAYLGAWPIVEALRRGADIVVAPRVTDASLVMAPAAWRFGWSPTDFDCLAGALWAGHAIECGSQVTGGNFSLFTELGDMGLPGMPIAEISADGSAVISKSARSGGAVTVDTIKAQLLYEVGGAAYHNPDVIADLSSVTLAQVGPNQVKISGAKGFAPTAFAKLSLGYEGGYRNTMTVGLTGGNVEAKTEWLGREVSKAVGDPSTFDQFRWSVIGPRSPHDGSYEDATAWVIITARDTDRAKVSRERFADRIGQLAVSNIPGFYMFTPPQRERLVGVQWPCLVPKSEIDQFVELDDGVRVSVDWHQFDDEQREPFTSAESGRAIAPPEASPSTLRVPLGSVFGTRSGDKAGMANVGIWARTEAQFAWLHDFMTIERLRELFPQVEHLRIERHVLSNLLALNFQLFGYLEDGVASCTRIDPQAKGVGEFLGSRLIDLSTELVPANQAERG
jgi:hypothetical protein